MSFIFMTLVLFCWRGARVFQSEKGGGEAEEDRKVGGVRLFACWGSASSALSNVTKKPFRVLRR